jgi:hypothetical protein
MDPNQIKEKVDALRKAIDGLGCDLTDVGLFARLSEVNGPLQQEATEQAAKAATLRESHEKLQPIAEAKQRVLARKVDEAVAECRDDDALAMRQEIADLKAHLEGVLTEAVACEARVIELDREQKENARKLFEETYERIRGATSGVVIASIQLLDKVWADLQRYGQENGPAPGTLGQPLVGLRHWADLTPLEHGPETPWFLKMREWFGGRRT